VAWVRKLARGALGHRALALADLEPVPAVRRLDVEHVAPREPQHAPNRRRHVLVQAVGELDDHDRAATWSADQPSDHGTCTMSELAQYDLHVSKTSIPRTGVDARP